MDIGIIDWTSEHALTDYPLRDFVGHPGFIVDANFVQFDGFIPVLNQITYKIDVITLTILFDNGPVDVEILKDSYVVGKGIRIFDSRDRYLGVIILGPGTDVLFETQAQKTVILNIPFAASTVASVNSNAGVYSIEGLFGNLQFNTGTASVDRSIFFNVTVPTTVVALLGNHGDVSVESLAVATLVQGWKPDAVVHLGNTGFPTATTAQLNAVNVPTYDFVRSKGTLFAALGDHDFSPDVNGTNIQDYLNFYNPPGNGRYYRKRIGCVELFVLNFGWNSTLSVALDQTATLEPDGIAPGSIQYNWLKSALASSTAPWKVVCFHPSAYNSHAVGTTRYPGYTACRWPFKEWGADIVYYAQLFTYERIVVNGLNYIMSGLGSAYTVMNYAATNVGPIYPNSKVRYAISPASPDVGAIRLTASNGQLVSDFCTKSGAVFDSVTIKKTLNAKITWNAVGLATLPANEVVALKTINGVGPVLHEVTFEDTDLIRVIPGIENITFNMVNSVLNTGIAPVKKYL